MNLRKLVNNKGLKQDKVNTPSDTSPPTDDEEQLKKSSPVSVLKTRVIKDGSGIVKIVNAPQQNIPYTQATGIKTLNADGSITPPLTAFDIWLREKHGGKDKTISPLLRQHYLKAYTQLSDKTKVRYITEANKLKNLHSLQHPGFKGPDEEVIPILQHTTITSMRAPGIIRGAGSSTLAQGSGNVQGVMQQARQPRTRIQQQQLHQPDMQVQSADVLGMALQSSGLMSRVQHNQDGSMLEVTQEAWEREQLRIEQQVGFNPVGGSSSGPRIQVQPSEGHVHASQVVDHDHDYYH